MADSELVIVGTDGSSFAESAVRWAADFASRHGSDLLIATAVSAPLVYKAAQRLPQGFFTDQESSGHEIVAKAATQAAESAANVRIDTVVLRGSAGAVLLELATHASTLIVGARGRGALAGAFLGSVSSQLARHADCPVVVVQGLSGNTPEPSGQPVVVGADGTMNSDPAVAAAAREAFLRDTTLVAVHAWSDDLLSAHPPLGTRYLTDEIALSRAILKEQLAPSRRQYPKLEISTVVAMDSPEASLWEWAAGAQLVVVGSRGRGGFAGLLLGSTSIKILYSAHCPVMIAHSPRDGVPSDRVGMGPARSLTRTGR